MKCRSCGWIFNPKNEKEGNAKKRKCAQCCFGDDYNPRNKRQYDMNLRLAVAGVLSLD